MALHVNIVVLWYTVYCLCLILDILVAYVYSMFELIISVILGS